MLKIITAPNPLLNTVCDPYAKNEFNTVAMRKFAKQLTKMMYKFEGVGLAAPQVGITKRMIVVDCTDQNPKDPFVLVNPEIVQSSKECSPGGEGCLSLPGIQVEINRHEWVRVSYADLEGNITQVEADGLLARCLQHEIDHLNGKTMFESCSASVRLKALQDYEMAKLNGARPGEVNSGN